jgi:lipid A ethanolaminephosphotransferase
MRHAFRGFAGSIVAAVVCFALATWIEDHDWFEVLTFQLARHDTPRPQFNALVYAATYLLCIGGLTVLLCHARRVVRYPALAVSGFMAAAFLGFESVNGYGFTHHEAALLWSESQFAGDALAFFFGSYALPAMGVVAGVIVFEICTRRFGIRVRSLWALVLPVLALAAGVHLVDRTYGKIYQLPVPYRVPLLAHWAWQHRALYYGKREPALLEPSREPLADHIVLVVDESVTGHWLGANGSGFDSTPYLSSRPAHVFNYGIASSVSNMSSITHLILQTGLGPSDLPDRELRALKAPNLFAYMQRAGFRAALIDAQSYSDRPPSLMSQFDFDALDEHIRIRERSPELVSHEIDLATIPILTEFARRGGRSFTYVIKTGAHMPYADKSPPDERPFQPVLSRWATWGDLDRLRNSYLNALRWTVDGFLERLSKALAETGANVLVVYTSDHGQSLTGRRPDAARRHTPHATPMNPPPEQASVPLLLLAFGPEVPARVAERYAPAVVDRASTFEVFSALLEAAGYAREDVQQQYPFSLFDAGADRSRRIFASGNIFAREGNFHILNPLMGDVCYLNEFTPPDPL